MREARISPSILSADFGNFREEVEAVTKAGCKVLHLDVMDGHFVPNITFGPSTIAALRKTVNIPFDIHLMIEDPENLLDAFGKAAGDVEGNIICVHQEVCPHLHRTLEKIHRLNDHMLAGVAINPGTPVNVLENVIRDADMILIMTVDPGFGGQACIEECLEKIAEVRSLCERKNTDVLIELDGGIKLSNMEKAATADMLVMGSAIFGKGPEEAAKNLKTAQAQFEAMYQG